MNKALFLDRDGVINQNKGSIKFINKADDFHLLPGIVELCLAAQKKGYKIIVVTNQGGVAMGFLTIEDLNDIHYKMMNEFLQQGVDIDHVYACLHHPDAKDKNERYCNCRKPKPGMILQAAKDYDIDLSQSIMIGDQETDIDAANAAKVGTAILFADREMTKEHWPQSLKE